MKQKLVKIKSKDFLAVHQGSAINAKDFNNQIIKPQFANKDSIKAIHKALIEYVNNNKAVYVLRLFGSDSKGNYDNLRRGFLTEYPDGRKIVFCDNTFAMPFTALKIFGEAYTSQELITYMQDKTTRFGFGSTKEERELAFYNWIGNKATINLNSYGWYLAHIVPVGKSFNGKNLRNCFNNPIRDEWENADDHIRRPDYCLTNEKLSILKAHFLRMVHPLNSFLVPKGKLIAYDGKNIGEEPELIDLVQDFLKDEFPEEYAELEDIMLIPQKEYYSSAPIGKIVWSNSESTIKNLKSKITPSREFTATMPLTPDIYDINEEEDLENTLRSIGKQAFLMLYPILKKNLSTTVKEVCKYWPTFRSYKPNAQRTRLSSSRRIIKNGLEIEALSNIANSTHVKQEVRFRAKELLCNL